MVDYFRYDSDAKGRPVSSNEGENPKTAIYDETDNLITLTSGESQIHKRYGCFGEISAYSNDGTITETLYGHDARGNLSGKRQNGSYDIGYAYSTINNMVLAQFPSARQESYTYTPNGNLDTIVSEGKTFDYEYYDTGLVKSLTYPNGLKTEYSYDNLGRVVAMATSNNGTTVNTLGYTYDNNGNVLTYTRDGQVTSYTYDSLDRLTSVTYPDMSSVTYTYDALNNLTKETFSNGDKKEYFYNEYYRLEKVKTNGVVTDTYTYNKTGAVTSHNGETYTYNQWDKLSEYSDGTNTYTYKYDANGIRTGKNNKQYIVDIFNNVVAETDDTGTIESEILWGNGKPLARKTNGNWYYYIYNGHGDVIGLVNDAGTIENTYEYDAWGNVTTQTESIDNPIKYAGEYYDEELGMYYLRARYYDPGAKRFTSHDAVEGSIANPMSMNRYAYCSNNPVNFVDPSGYAKEGDERFSKSVRDEISIYGQIWTDADVAYSLGIINVYEKISVQSYAERMADNIRYQADHPIKSFISGAVEFAVFEVVLGDLNGGTIYAADLSGPTIEKMYGNQTNLNAIINTSPMIAVAAVNSSSKGRTLVNTKINGKMTRVDIEYPQGGKPANLHVQIKGTGQKVMIESLDDLDKLPKAIGKNKVIVNTVKKGLKFLGKLF